MIGAGSEIVRVIANSTGVITALAAEAATFGPMRGPTGAARAVWIATAGVGGTRARAAANMLVERGASALLSWGTAGGLDPTLAPGSLVAYDSVSDHCGGVIACDRAWTNRIAARLAAFNPGRCSACTVSEPLASRADKAALRRRLGGAAVDMESAAIGEVARAAGIPFAAVRCIVDPAAFTLPRAALVALAGDGSPRRLPLIAALLRRPWEIADLIRLGAWYRRALAQLARAAALLGDDFAR